MLIESRTLNQIFESWKNTNINFNSWCDYWNFRLTECINLYKKFNWKLVKIAKNSKLPIRNVHWTQVNLNYDDALIHFKERNNIAIDLSKSNLIVADYDNTYYTMSNELKFYLDKTVSVITKSSHYHIFFNYDEDFLPEKLEEIAIKLKCDKDLWRGKPNKNQYVLLPLSQVDKKVYEFIYLDKLMNISEVIT